MVVNELQAKTVKFIFNEFLEGIGINKIKDELEENGMLTATGLKKWNVSTIARILHNSFYCGIVEYRKSYIPDYLEQKPKVNRGEVEKIVVEGKHEPLISKEDFYKVQRMLEEKIRIYNKEKNWKKAPKSIWSKKMVCSCGSAFNKRKSHKYKNFILYHYECYRRRNYGNKILINEEELKSCDMPYIQEWKLDLMANIIFKELCRGKTRIIKMANNLIDTKIKSCLVSDSNYEIVGYNNKKSMIENKKQRLIDLYLNQLITKEEFNSKKSNLDCELENIDEKIKLLKCESSISKEELISKLENLKDIMKSNLYCQKNGEYISEKVINNFISKIVVYKDKFEWYLRCGESKDKSELLGIIKVTKDDVKKYTIDHTEYSKLRMKDDILIYIYI